MQIFPSSEVLEVIILPFQFVGHYDEILDMAFVGENHSMLSVASNSPGIKVIDINTLDCRILSGHSGEDDNFSAYF